MSILYVGVFNWLMDERDVEIQMKYKEEGEIHFLGYLVWSILLLALFFSLYYLWNIYITTDRPTRVALSSACSERMKLV